MFLAVALVYSFSLLYSIYLLAYTIHSTTDEHLDHLHFEASMNNVAVNIFICFLVYKYISHTLKLFIAEL